MFVSDFSQHRLAFANRFIQDLPHGWYDLTVSQPGAALRLAGQVENGRPSTSDPALSPR